MAHMMLSVKGLKYTTREGDHPDDELYIEQVKGMVLAKLADLGFIRVEVDLTWRD